MVESTSRLPNGERASAKVHVLMGRIYYQGKQLVEAAREWELALVVPRPHLLRLLPAEMYRDLGQREQAVLLQQAVSSSERSPESDALLKPLESAY